MSEIESTQLNIPYTSTTINRDNFKFQIKQIIGTSARTKQQLSIQDDLIAYTASGGVVVNKINKSNNEVISQRFFCANNSTKHNNDSIGISSANAYLDIIKGNVTGIDDEVKKDSYGFQITNEPLEIYGNSFSSNDFEDNAPNNGASPSKLKDKVRSINCITISPNKKLLAIGETGYQPRVLIFSLAPNSQDSPIMVIYEHSYGIDKLVFSPDSKNLCSLGVINDGCINIWKLTLSGIVLQASNRCSNIINKILWHENLIITIGLRFIKIWSFENNNSNKPIVLKGRNAHLGILMSLNFIHMSILNDDEVLIVTNFNHLLVLKLNFDSPKLVALKSPSEEFYSICVDYMNELVWLGGINDKITSLPIKNLTPVELNTINLPPPESSSTKLHQKLNGIFGVSYSELNSSQKLILQLNEFSKDYLIYLSENEEIRFYNKEDSNLDKLLTNSIINSISGVKKSYNKDYLVFSKDGVIKKLTDSCDLENLLQYDIPGNEVITNTLTAVEHFNNKFVLGDRYGSLYIVEKVINDDQESESNVIFQIKAHTSTINKILYFKQHDHELICTISRDRTIQMFVNKPAGWELLQTIPIHNGNVFEISLHENQLIVCSSDRTISVHTINVEPDLMLTTFKIITLKSTPVVIGLFENELVVSTIDKQLLIYDLNFDLKRSMKLTNEKLNESLLVELMVKYQNLLIVSCSDKSLRAFDYTTGKSIGVSWGHSESLMALFINNNDEIISIGNDGCLFAWSINSNEKIRPQSIERSLTDEDFQPLYSKVARKILPTVPIGSTSPKDTSIDKNTLGGVIGSNKESLTNKTPLISPDTPTPKLSTATLKRMEAKKTQSTTTSPARSRSVSPVRSSQPQKSTTVTTTSTSTIRSPTRPTFPLHKSQNALSGITKLNQPLSSPSPARRGPTSPKSSVDLGSSNKARPFIQLNSSPTRSSFKFNNTSLPNQNNTTSNNNSLTPNTIDFDSTMKFMDNLIENSSKFKDDEKQKLVNKLNELKLKLGVNPTNETDILENYSNKLISLVEQKLNIAKNGHTKSPLNKRDFSNKSNSGISHDDISTIIATNVDLDLKEINSSVLLDDID
ncbi:hypothetical protein KGF54_000961 [Candida jiufengensis]|uniref:uncharacterized protein n=1 Tax=Candida jiufengensis TaxID=497108 RepID=UPI002225A4D2|nr:uncharacterized protein KGF54_000961 [Candida jiufengensis]KAI5956486.1 hypothetical protein KGF54_000961 [Candida jiufengensis]